WVCLFHRWIRWQKLSDQDEEACRQSRNLCNHIRAYCKAYAYPKVQDASSHLQLYRNNDTSRYLPWSAFDRW
ncbi:hypothetical protein MUCCIDRAFT_155885, partial [Mucor lusitanicus CBS 277.49]